MNISCNFRPGPRLKLEVLNGRVLTRPLATNSILSLKKPAQNVTQRSMCVKLPVTVNNLPMPYRWWTVHGLMRLIRAA